MDAQLQNAGLAAAIVSLAGYIARMLTKRGDEYRAERDLAQAELRQSTEAMRDLSAYVKASAPLLAELAALLPHLRAMAPEPDDPPARKPRARP